MASEGIIHERTTVNTPQQNGISERFNRFLEEGITSMLAQAHFPRALWGQALALLIRIANATPTSRLKGMTPYEAFYGKKPSASHFRVFGCPAFVHMPKEKRKKLDPKSR